MYLIGYCRFAGAAWIGACAWRILYFCFGVLGREICLKFFIHGSSEAQSVICRRERNGISCNGKGNEGV